MTAKEKALEELIEFYSELMIETQTEIRELSGRLEKMEQKYLRAMENKLNAANRLLETLKKDPKS